MTSIETSSGSYSGRDLVGYGETCPDPEWPGGAKVAVSFVVNFEEVRFEGGEERVSTYYLLMNYLPAD